MVLCLVRPYCHVGRYRRFGIFGLHVGGSSPIRWRCCVLNLDAAARQQHSAVEHGQGWWWDLVLSGNTVSVRKSIAVRMYTVVRRRKRKWLVLEHGCKTLFGLRLNVVRLRVGMR